MTIEHDVNWDDFAAAAGCIGRELIERAAAAAGGALPSIEAGEATITVKIDVRSVGRKLEVFENATLDLWKDDEERERILGPNEDDR